MQPRNKIRGATQAVQRNFSHSGHDAHARDDVGAVGDLDSDAALRRSCWTQDVWNNVHRAAFHRAIEQSAEGLLGIGWGHPIVCWSGVRALSRTDIGHFFRACYVTWIAAMEEAIRIRLV